MGRSFICDGAGALKGPEFEHAQPDGKDEAELLTSLATDPRLRTVCPVQQTLTVIHVLEQKRVTVRHSSVLGLAGWKPSGHGLLQSQ